MKPMTSATAKMRSTQLEENVSNRVIQYIPAYHTDTQSHTVSHHVVTQDSDWK